MFREIQLDNEQWKNIPESSALAYDYSSCKEDTSAREAIHRKIMPLIARIVSLDITPKQREVVTLYFRYENTQVRVARILGIMQPTVSQHLGGKKRKGNKVGGSFRRIRKNIHEKAGQEDLSDDENSVLRVLDSLLDRKITHRRTAELLNTLLR